jgi:hypothetical protein
MKTLKITWKGTTPLIMHSCQCVNPMHPIAKQMKEITSKRKKTEEDLKVLSDLEWEAGAYWKEGLGLYIPAENVEATLMNGAKAFKRGKDVQKYCSVMDLYIPFNYGENLTKEQLISNYEYRDTRPMTVMRAKVFRTRPRFDQWNISFNLQYDETQLDLKDLMQFLEYAGSYVGLCDSRPKYGKFVVLAEELD